MTTTTQAATKKVAFKWTAENTAKAVALYQAKLADTLTGDQTPDSIAAAADNEFLLSIAKEVGAVSEKSVRGKLTREEVYVKPEHVASVAKTTKLRKEHFVRSLINILGLDEVDVDSLKNGKQCALEALTDALGIKNVEEASKTGYEARPEEIIHNFMNALKVDFDDLDVYQEELAEAAQTLIDEAEAKAEEAANAAAAAA